jgi:hypothetical protein
MYVEPHLCEVLELECLCASPATVRYTARRLPACPRCHIVRDDSLVIDQSRGRIEAGDAQCSGHCFDRPAWNAWRDVIAKTVAIALAVAALLLFGACAGDPFELADEGGAALLTDIDGGPPLDAGDVLDSSILDAQHLSRDSAAAGDAIPETTPPVSDGSAGTIDARPPPPVDASADAQAPEASAPDSAPPAAVCCVGAGQVSCSGSATVRCYAPGASCSATNVYGPDGGQYQTASCPGAYSACGSVACAAGSPCLWAGTEPGQWLPGSVEACR